MELYGTAASPPVRAVLLTLAELGMPYEFKQASPSAGDTKTDEFLKMNPTHTIPTLNDEGFYLFESRAIMCYLANKHGKTDLYPACPKKRAIVDQMLYFDATTLTQRMGQVVRPIFHEGAKEPSKTAMESVNDALGLLDTLVQKNGGWMAADHVTIADFALLASISTIAVMGMFDLSKHAKVSAWFDKCKSQVPSYEKACGEGAAQLAAYVKQKMQEATAKA